MSVFQLELSADLREAVARHATDLGVSEAEWVEEAIRARLTAAAQMKYLRARGERGDRNAFDQVLRDVPSVPPNPGDEW